jgi:Lambda phage tail tube protein, TTP
MVSPTTPTTALIGYQTIVAIEADGSPGVFIPLVEVKEVIPPSAIVDDVEASHYQSPGRTREYIAGAIDGGEATVLMNWIPGSATDDRIIALRESGARKQFKITWPNSLTWEFSGRIKGYECRVPLDGVMEATATIKVDSSQSVATAPTVGTAFQADAFQADAFQ